MQPSSPPPDGNLPGTVVCINVNHGDFIAPILNVTRHAPEEGQIHYSILYGELEVQQFEIQCGAEPHGGTAATIRTITMGLNEPGNHAVENYIESGRVEIRNNKWRAAINEYLSGKES